MNIFDRIYEVVQTIPRGKVATYREVASCAGNPRWSRVVGYALHANPRPFSLDPRHDNSDAIPCHRVVFSDGRLAEGFSFGGADAQKRMLEAEGVKVIDNRVDLKKYDW